MVDPFDLVARAVEAVEAGRGGDADTFSRLALAASVADLAEAVRGGALTAVNELAAPSPGYRAHKPGGDWPSSDSPFGG